MLDKDSSELTNEELIESMNEIQKLLLAKHRQNLEIEKKIEKREGNFRQVEKSLQQKLQNLNMEIQWVNQSVKRKHWNIPWGVVQEVIRFKVTSDCPDW